MRYLYILLIIAVFSGAGKAQNNLVKEALPFPQEMQILKLNKSGLPHLQTAKLTDGKIYKPSIISARTLFAGGTAVSRDSIIYNSCGLEIYRISLVDSGYGFVKLLMDSSYYDEKGNLTNQPYYEWKKGVWELYGRVTMEYNEKGLPRVNLTERVNEGKIDGSEIVYSYDDKDRAKEAIVSQVEAGVKTPVSRYEYAYNDMGLKTLDLCQTAVGESWVNYARYVYNYDDKGNEISYAYYRWLGDWVVYQDSKYYYFDGQLRYSLYRVYTSGALINDDSTAYTYDANGHMSSKINCDWVDNKEWKNVSKWDYLHIGTSPKPAIETYSLWNGTDWTGKNRYSYEYNKNMDVISKIISAGLKGGLWEQTRKLVFEYDNNYNLLKGENFIWAEGGWISENGDIPMNNTEYYAYIVENEYISFDQVGIDNENIAPDKFSLAQNYPNPFNPETKINFSLPQSGKATLRIYDMLGREVAELVNQVMDKGAHTVSFSGINLSSGVYIYRLQSGAFTQSKKMMLIK